VKVIVAEPPQLKLRMPPPVVWTEFKAMSNAASLQEIAVPLPTTALLACAVAEG
jgi:hypothetical protein